ncbi:MAG: SUMF1/EgtB/PvdO family nonheme iron enzyme [Bacteroidetes bacterium]|nr:SUMF1/EgtB/PvdO family nonheme iron enzyme [Bacteroidota bacterium]MCL2302013.1 SUMF1/EgtB/PvdO family nonheme iron enzyme [Lentimicrobiaceae bacterium]
MNRFFLKFIAIIVLLAAIVVACKKDKQVIGITLHPITLTLLIDETATLTATVFPEDAANKVVSWVSNNHNVAIVNNNGEVLAKAEGRAIITVTTQDGNYRAACIVTVVNSLIPVTGITLTPTTLSLIVTETATLIATVFPEDADNKAFGWENSNPDVVTLDNGKVTAKAAGTAIITVTTQEGNHTATCEITVTKPYYVEPEMVFVEGGTFIMGCTDGECGHVWEEHQELPAHQVTVSSFQIAKYQITQKQWESIMGNNPSHFKGDNLPVEQISWYDAQEFIQKLNHITGKNYRLPTDAEWEYAARGGNKSQGYKYSGSNNLNEVSWGHSNTTYPVGTKAPNELGIYDMSGNVREWCSDWYEDYTDAPQTNPTGPATGSHRVLRNGGYSNGEHTYRVSYRIPMSPDSRHATYGIRLVLP